jgi:hypothetical protein
VKIVLAVLWSGAFLLAPRLPAANSLNQPPIAPGCGDPVAKFDVTTAKSTQPIGSPEAGKALVYFVEDDAEFASRPTPTTRIGLDGQWVGATHGNSHLSFSVDPGEHHLCSSWQSTVILAQGHKSAAAHFTAAAGKTYFFKVTNKWNRDVGAAITRLDPLDSDEGRLLVNTSALSTSHPKQ